MHNFIGKAAKVYWLQESFAPWEKKNLWTKIRVVWSICTAFHSNLKYFKYKKNQFEYSNHKVT